MRSAFSFFNTHDGVPIRYAIRHCGHATQAGSIILLGGRREFIEKYTETIDELNQRSFDVYTMDWRGQGLSGRELSNRHKGYVRSYEDYLGDLDRFFTQVVNSRALLPRIILAHSMGGHIALRYLHDHPDSVAKAVLSAPMIDIASSHVNGRLIRTFARLAVGVGLGRMYVVGSGDYRASDQHFEGNRLTSDPQRFRDEQKAIAVHPDLALGGVTYQWLKASLESIDILNSTGYPESIRTPVLMVAAGADRVVSIKAQQRISERLPNGRFQVISRARHELLKETDQVRRVFWEAFDGFVKAHLEGPRGYNIS